MHIWHLIRLHRRQFSNFAEELSDKNLTENSDLSRASGGYDERRRFSNCNSFDSSNEDDVIGSDYESCNGLDDNKPVID